MKTFKLVVVTLVTLLASQGESQTLTKGVQYEPRPSVPCAANTSCGWVAATGQVQFYDGVTATAKTMPSIVTSAKGDVAVWNGSAWVKFARCPVDGQVMAANAAAASGWVCAAAGGTQTLAQTYAAGASSADSIMSLDSTRGPVVIKDNATPLTGSLFAVQNNAMSVSYIDVNPTENAVQFGVTGPGLYGASISSSEVFLGPTALSYSFTSDNAQNVGSATEQAANVFTRIVSAVGNTLALIGGSRQVNLSSTGLDPNVDVQLTLGTLTKRWLSFAVKTGTIFYDLMGSSSAQGRSLLLRGTNLATNYPGVGQVEYSPLIEFQQAFGQTSDPESGFAQARMALQGQMPQVSLNSTAGNQIAVLSDSGTGTYTKVMSIMNDGSLLPGVNTGPVCGDATHRFLSIAEGNDTVGTGQVVGVSLSNKAAATAGNQKYSPVLEFEGQGWKTNATAASQSVKIGVQLRPVQDAVNPRAEFLDFYTSINGGAYTRMGTIAMDPGSNGQGIAITSANYNGSNAGFHVFANNSQINFYDVNGARAMYYDGASMYPTDLTTTFGKSNARLTESWVRSQYGVQQTVTSSGAIVLNPALGDTYRLVSNGNVTGITVSTGTFPDQTLKLILIQDAAGTNTWPVAMTNVTFSGGAFAKTLTADAVDVYTLTYDNTSTKWREAARALNQTL